MNGVYTTVKPYEGVVRDHADWLERTSPERQLHPRELQIPLLVTRGDEVVLFQNDRRSFMLPSITFHSSSHPLQDNERWQLYRNGEYQRVQRFVGKYVADSLLRRPIIPYEMRFMECWKAYSSDLHDTNGTVVLEQFPTLETMVDVKQLPFHVSLDPSQAVRRKSQGNEIALKKLNKLRNLLSTLMEIDQPNESLVEIYQIINALDSLPARRDYIA